ncbi:hypothetical protein QC762_0070490 [Podospora pseudocomata]|uniref:Uncharacterized protein n=1 Tax=Podospora pseudocomata TaxID=2093779 RepID=A0ABR0GGM0_9PEZI|nr:hypothetical protein QC762_0070490 [Podospora pseudocomata]
MHLEGDGIPGDDCGGISDCFYFTGTASRIETLFVKINTSLGFPPQYSHTRLTFAAEITSLPLECDIARSPTS